MNTPVLLRAATRRAFTLLEVMVSATLLVLILAVVLSLALFCTDSVRRQTLAFDATDAVHRLVSKLNSDCSGVGIVQLFKGMPAGAVPPFAAGTWDGRVTDGNFMIIAYPANILCQNSPIARMCAYYLDPRDNSLMRIEAKYTGMAGGGTVVTGDLMTELNKALNKATGTSYTTERVCYIYPWSMQAASPSGVSGWAQDATVPGSVVLVPSSGDAANMVPQSLFYAYGAGTLSINGSVAVIFGKDAAKASINYTLNVHN